MSLTTVEKGLTAVVLREKNVKRPLGASTQISAFGIVPRLSLEAAQCRTVTLRPFLFSLSVKAKPVASPTSSAKWRNHRMRKHLA
jgi:hypothetical protein